MSNGYYQDVLDVPPTPTTVPPIKPPLPVRVPHTEPVAPVVPGGGQIYQQPRKSKVWVAFLVIGLIALILVVGWLISRASAAPLPLDTVVFVRNAEGGSGSGVIITPGGYILTNAHVVASAREKEEVTILYQSGTENSRTLKATVEKKGDYAQTGRDQSDWALLKVEGSYKFPVIALGKDTPPDLKKGDDVIALGFPMSSVDGADRTGPTCAVAKGDVSAFQPNDATPNSLLYDANTQQGNSGGPIVNTKGEMVALNKGVTQEDAHGRRKTVGIPVHILKAQLKGIVPGW